MNSRCVPFAVLALATLVPAQEPPKPAAELQQLAAFVGNWQGEGTMTEPGNVVTKWKGIGTYQWALDGHFVREDFRIEFDGMPVPVVMHGYLGWDRENQRFVHLHVSSAGEAALHTMTVAGGAATSFSLHEQGGMAYSQRMVFAVRGDTLSHTVDLLLPQGPSLAMVAGSFRRGGDGFAGKFDSPAFNGAVPHADLARLTKSAGDYQTEGQMVMAPGMPPIKITGTDRFRAAYGGVLFHGHTEGAAEGMPGKYVGEVFWAYEPKRKSLFAVYLSNMGEIMAMDGRWTADGQLLSTSNGLAMGKVMVQRMLMQFGPTGEARSANAHTIVDTAPPYESFRAKYERAK
jgi:hypothetical protein